MHDEGPCCQNSTMVYCLPIPSPTLQLKLRFVNTQRFHLRASSGGYGATHLPEKPDPRKSAPHATPAPTRHVTAPQRNPPTRDPSISPADTFSRYSDVSLSLTTCMSVPIVVRGGERRPALLHVAKLHCATLVSMRMVEGLAEYRFGCFAPWCAEGGGKGRGGEVRLRGCVDTVYGVW